MARTTIGIAVGAAVISALVLLPETTLADSHTTGRDLIAQCQEVYAAMSGRGGNLLSSGRCLGYIEGVSAGHQMLEGKGDGWGICLPEHGSLGTTILLLLETAQNRPNLLDVGAWGLVTRALKDAYPC